MPKYGHYGQKMHFPIDFIFQKHTFSKQARDDKNFELSYALISQFLADLALKMTIIDQNLTQILPKNRPKIRKSKKLLKVLKQAQSDGFKIELDYAVAGYCGGAKMPQTWWDLDKKLSLVGIWWVLNVLENFWWG